MQNNEKNAAVRTPIGLPSIVCAWLSLVAVGVCALASHDGNPGLTSPANLHWHVEDRLPRPAGVATLVMVVHPLCPCTRASFNELDTLLTRCSGRLNAIVLFVALPGVAQDPAASELWQSVAKVPGVRCVIDLSGNLAARFGARTSGQVYLYDGEGALQFSGGITASRGHAGDNDGFDAIEAIINGQTPVTRQTPVFGCSLR